MSETKANPSTIPTDESKADCESKAAHTPGPWRVEDRRRAALPNVRILGASDTEVGQVSDVHMRDPRSPYQWTHEQADRLDARGLANAELIVTAVNAYEGQREQIKVLLAACEVALAECGHYGSLSFSAVAQLEAAIRKGKGE